MRGGGGEKGKREGRGSTRPPRYPRSVAAKRRPRGSPSRVSPRRLLLPSLRSDGGSGRIKED